MLVTGAGGFIGTHLLPVLHAAGWHPESVDRTRCDPDREPNPGLFAGVDAVVHLAGIAHRTASIEELTRVNERWPVALYRAASRAGVRRFLWLSSIKVLGDVSTRPLVPTDPYSPGDAYACSKVRAEQALLEAAAVEPATLTILRPPLVYGPGVKANFRTLLTLAGLSRWGLPVPLARAQAPRSLIGVRNLCDLMVTALGHAGIYHGADARDLTVAELLRRLGARVLVPLPVPAARRLAKLSRLEAYYQRLFEPLQVDQRQTEQQLGWRPPHSITEELEETLRWFRGRP